MELTAVIQALQCIAAKQVVDGYSGWEVNLCVDSKYVMDGALQWLPGWKSRGWKTSSGGLVKNKELWQRLDALLQCPQFTVLWTWVKGHSGNFGNETADTLANEGVPT